MHRVLVPMLLLLSLLAAPAEGARRQVPQGWLGVTVDGPVSADDDGEWDRMAGAGVETVRDRVPLVPRCSRAAERARLLGHRTRSSPRRGAARHRRPAGRGAAPDVGRGAPRRPAVAAGATRPRCRRSSRRSSRATGRAARSGRERPELPRLPIRAWQVWNEPNLTGLLVRAALRTVVRRDAARGGRRRCARADPGATVVLAGLTNRSWIALRQLYKAGARGLFDAVALHPYTREPRQRAAARAPRTPGDARSTATRSCRSGSPSSRGRQRGADRPREAQPPVRHRGDDGGAVQPAPRGARAVGRSAQASCGSSASSGTRGCRARRARARSTGPGCGACAHGKPVSVPALARIPACRACARGMRQGARRRPALRVTHAARVMGRPRARARRRRRARSRPT